MLFRSPLMYVSEKNYIKFVKYLVDEAGASVHTINETNKFNAYAYAINKYNEEIAVFLQQKRHKY